MPFIIWLPSDFPASKVLATRVRKPESPHTLGFSLYLAQYNKTAYADLGRRIISKTCPRCSAERGHFVWHSMDRYSYRILNGKLMPQSWCDECRHDQSKRKRRLAHDGRSGRIRKRK